MDASPLMLRPEATISEAMHHLENSKFKICLVVNKSGILQRTVSDGDIRRGILKNLDLTEVVTRLPGRTPVTAHSDMSEDQQLEIMEQEGVQFLIVVDKNRKVQGIRSITELADNILLSSPHIGINESLYVKQAFDTNWIAPIGPNINLFEERLKLLSGRANVVAVSSGTAGLHLALKALNLPEGSNIYVSDKTFIASVQPILYERMVPTFIDCEPETWNMSPEALGRRLKHDKSFGELPKAIILTHLYGQPAKLDKIMEIADYYGIPLIEDASESLGASYKNNASGSHGLISVFSFNGNKIITTSAGGAVLTDDERLSDRVRLLATQGREDADHYQHSHVAYNYRMSNILAGVGLGQLEVLSDRVVRRREIYSHYKRVLQNFGGIKFQEESADSLGNRWLSVISLDPNYFTIHPYQLMRQLNGRGVEVRPSFKPMHMQPLLTNYSLEPHSPNEVISSKLFLQSICLPSGSNITQRQQDRILANLVDILDSEIS